MDRSPVRRIFRYLAAVLPANLHVALNDVAVPGFSATPLLAWIRLPFQLVFVAWVLWCTSPPSKP